MVFTGKERLGVFTGPAGLLYGGPVQGLHIAARKITISTVGLPKQMRRLADYVVCVIDRKVVFSGQLEELEASTDPDVMAFLRSSS